MLSKADLDKAWEPLEPFKWPDGTEQPVKRLTWRFERMLPDLSTGEDDKVDAILPQIMPAILPGRSWDEIQDSLDGQTMRDIITYASRAYHTAMAELERRGNAEAGAAPASPPPIPEPPSSVASPEPTAVPCGVS